MRYLLFICTDPEAEPYRRDLDNVGSWVEEMDAKKIRLEGERLKTPEHAVTLRKRGGQLLVTDGPFAESKEWIAGFDLIECPDLDAAVEVASRHPMARFGRIEVRPLNSDPSLQGVHHPISDFAGLFLQLLCTDPESEPYKPNEDNIASWVKEMDAKGVLVQGHLLCPVQDATLVRVRKDEVLVTDGPFAETKEWVQGFGILRCRDRAEAVEVSSSHPAARFGRIEVREFWPFV